MEQEVLIPPIIEKKKYSRMNPNDQEEYIEKKIKEILDSNPEGVTIPEIDEKTPFSRPTIIKHLERLVACRDAYKIKRRKLTIYYPNGRIVHPEHMVKIENDTGGIFRGTFLNNNFGQFVYLEEINDKNISGGGMLMNIKNIPIFKDLVDKLEEKRRLIEE